MSVRLGAAAAGNDPVITRDFASYRAIIHYSLPLILSYPGGIIMQFTDRIFLAWHVLESVAGAGTARIIPICVVSFFRHHRFYLGTY